MQNLADTCKIVLTIQNITDTYKILTMHTKQCSKLTKYHRLCPEFAKILLIHANHISSLQNCVLNLQIVC
jgi:hypothetical protein